MTEIPRFLGKFRVDGVLGRGAMGTVYKAHDPDIDRVVALKLVRTDLLSGDDRAHYLARFQNEARIVGRCVHPNIVGIHDFTVHGDSPVLVLEYVDGQHLGKLLAGTGPSDLGFVKRTVLSVLDALGHAHAFGIVHRDVKPANILVGGNAAIKVTDFGISHAIAPDLTMDSMLVGTPCYMSPEQCRGEPVDARSDLFSVGCVLYEMLAGRRAFSGETYIATMQEVLHASPPALAELRPDLPSGIVRLVDAALAKDPRNRFGSAREMAQEVRTVFEPVAAAGASVDGASAVALPRLHRPDALATIEGSTLSSIERRLTVSIGPMARHHLRHALARTETPEALSKELAALVHAGPERERLEADLLSLVASDASLTAAKRGAGPDGSGSALQAAGALYGRLLAQVMGPIAPLLVRRALLKATTPEQLRAAILHLIDTQEQRAQFQSLLPLGEGVAPTRAQKEPSEGLSAFWRPPLTACSPDFGVWGPPPGVHGGMDAAQPG